MAKKATGPATTVTITGLTELRKRLQTFEKELLPAVTALNREGAQMVAETARSRAPVRSGRLRGSIKATASRTRGLVKVGGGLLPYAGPIHFGWPAHNIKANPFLYDAAAARRVDVLALYERRIGELTDEVHGE